MLPITEVAAKLGIGEEDIELYGRYKAKLSMDLIKRVQDKPDGKLILVTAITPTPAGEGKSTTTEIHHYGRPGTGACQNRAKSYRCPARTFTRPLHGH